MSRHVLHIDIETRSRANLKRHGMYPYVRCPDFKILMASYSLDGEPVRTALDVEGILEIPGLWDPSVVKVAHNAAFERVCFSVFSEQYRGGADLTASGYLDPEHYYDTMAVARELGYPASLGALAPALGATPKDEAGTRLINLFCKPRRDGGWNGPDTHPAEWLDFIAYCEQDVETLAEVHALLEAQGGWPTEMERAVYLADQRINDRGIRIDMDLCRKAVAVAAEVTEEQKEEVRATTLWEVENPGSTQQLHAWLDDQGHPLPNLQKETVERALVEDLPAPVKTVLELRQDLALAAPAKFVTALASQVDGRLHGTLAFFGAHTGRWAGRGTQVQNLPRDTFKPVGADAERLERMKAAGCTKAEIEAEEGRIIDRMTEAAIMDLLMDNGMDAATLKKLVRPMFLLGTDTVGEGVVVDYSAIEAVVISWLAGEEWALAAFREKRDIYVETAKQMGGLTRAQGKIAVLALGFNGGAGSLKAMATDRDVIDVDGVPTKLALVPDEILYERFVWPWRDANPNIVRLWANLDRRFRTGGEVGDHLSFEKANGNRDRLLRLPSGRAIAYRRAGLQQRTKKNPRTGKMETKKVLTFQSPQGMRVDTYGGRLAENVTQAVARDLTAAALVRLERAGLEVVGHVHDEILVQGTKDVDLVREIMCELPPWAEGLPVDGDGFVTARYKK